MDGSEKRSVTPAALEPLREQGVAVEVLVAPNGDETKGPGTNTWIVGDLRSGGCVVIDPGPDEPAHVENILRSCEALGLKIVGIPVTHHHADHAEAAPSLSQACGAPVLQYSKGTLHSGLLGLEGFNVDMQAIPLPGHTGDSFGFLMPDEGLLFSGDFIFADTSTLLCWPDGDLESYLNSLDMIEEMAEDRGLKILCPGHGDIIENPAKRARSMRQHRSEGLFRVCDAINEQGARTVGEVLDIAYRDVPEELFAISEMSARAQVYYAISVGLVSADDFEPMERPSVSWH